MMTEERFHEWESQKKEVKGYIFCNSCDDIVIWIRWRRLWRGGCYEEMWWRCLNKTSDTMIIRRGTTSQEERHHLKRRSSKKGRQSKKSLTPLRVRWISSKCSFCSFSHTRVSYSSLPSFKLSSSLFILSSDIIVNETCFTRKGASIRSF